jgi:hypothetical protein
MPDKPSAFEGLFDNRLNQMPKPVERNDATPTSSTPEPVIPEPEPKKKPKPLGKRSDPDYKQYSVLLKKQTHKQVTRELDDLENGQDVSVLVQHLLEQWLKKQQQKRAS